MPKKVSIIGAPLDLGQARRGVDMGPSAIRYAGLIDRLKKLPFQIDDLGDVEIPQRAHQKNGDHPTLRNLEAVVKANENLAQAVSDQVGKGNFPLVLGGDHSIAIGTVAGVAKHYENLGVIWYDAHGDLNTDETTPSGNIHGMPLAASLGLGNPQLTDILYHGQKVKPENVVLIGIRELDEAEKDFIKKLNIRTYTMHEVDRLGMAKVVEETIEYLKERTDGVHLSFDLDGIDPTEAPGVGTPVIGGATYRESHLALEMLAESGLITSAEFVEVNPMLDKRNKTVTLTVALIASLLGEKLL